MPRNLEPIPKIAEKPWQPYRFRTDFKLLQQAKTGHVETRGRPEKYDDESLIAIYIEVEALARAKTGGKIDTFLQNIHARIVDEGEDWKPRRLNDRDRARIRKLHQKGQKEVLHLKQTLFMGRPHLKWVAIEQTIHSRMAEIRASSDRLFFLTDM